MLGLVMQIMFLQFCSAYISGEHHTYAITTSILVFGKSTCIEEEMEGRYRGGNCCSIRLYGTIELIFVVDLNWQKKGYIL